MATVTIPDSTYNRLKETAAAMRLPLEEFLDRVAAEGLRSPSGDPLPAKPGTAQWNQAFEAWVATHASQANVADDSRDAIYSDERE